MIVVGSANLLVHDEHWGTLLRHCIARRGFVGSLPENIPSVRISRVIILQPCLYALPVCSLACMQPCLLQPCLYRITSIEPPWACIQIVLYTFTSNAQSLFILLLRLLNISWPALHFNSLHFNSNEARSCLNGSLSRLQDESEDESDDDSNNGDDGDPNDGAAWRDADWGVMGILSSWKELKRTSLGYFVCDGDMYF
jgi:hypothetical protein